MSTRVHPQSTASIGRALRRVATLGVATVLVSLLGCASLPAPAPRLHSEALPAQDGTSLARIAEESLGGQADTSGLRLMADGDDALDARLALIRRAERSLDLQYYLLASDEVGLRVLRELRDAAARGVRVRLLLDDLYAAGQDELLAGLASHPNVEVRLFNPLPSRHAGFSTRLLLSLHEFKRINHRMHNKLFIADNAFAIAGGRNIANEYFMRSESANFIDMDVLISGPVVQSLSSVFDRYWNSEQAWPVQQVATGVDTAQARLAFEVQVAAAVAPVPVEHDRFGRTSVQAQLAAGRVEQFRAGVRVLVDDPAKAQGDTREDASTSAAAAREMASARDELLIVSPYFVPGSKGLARMQEAVSRNVRLTVMTNSLSATDEPAVHSGYARYRTAMLGMGVNLHELKSSLNQKAGVLGNLRSSRARLHAKAAVIDQQRVLIGSLNMDGRSEHFNTEIALVIDNAGLAREVASLLDAGLQQADTYRLRLAEDGQSIEWLASEGQAPVVHQSEPEAGWMLRLESALKAALVDEDML